MRPSPPWHSSLLLLLTVAAGCGSLTETSATQALDEAAPPALDQLELWLDGSRGVGLSGDQVAWWEDQSGHGHTMVRGSPDLPSVTVAKYPGSERLGLLFLPESTFSGGYLVNSGVVIKGPVTVAMAIHPYVPPHTGHGEVPYEDVPFTGLRSPTFTIARRTEPGVPDNDEFRATSGRSSTYTAISVPGSWSQAPHVVIATFAGDQSSISVDGVRRAGALFAGSTLDGVALSAGGRTFSGFIGEVLVYRGFLGRPGEAELAAYLAARYPH